MKTSVTTQKLGQSRSQIIRGFYSALFVPMLALSLFALIVINPFPHPQKAHAQSPDGATYSEYVPLVPLPYTTYAQRTDKGQDSGTPCDPNAASGGANECKTNFLTYLRGLFRLMVALSAALAIVYIAYGGFQYVLAATEMGKSGGKETIQRALTGLIVVLCSYLIIYTINPELVDLQFSASKISSSSLETSSIFLQDPVRAGDIERQKIKYKSDRAKLSAEKAALQAKINSYDEADEYDPVKKAQLDKLRSDLNTVQANELTLVRSRVSILTDEIDLTKNQILATIATTEDPDAAKEFAAKAMTVFNQSSEEAVKDSRLLGAEENKKVIEKKDAITQAVAKAIDCRQKFPTNTSYRPSGQTTISTGGTSPRDSLPRQVPTMEAYSGYADCVGQ